MEEVFTKIYENRTWGDNNHSDYSGSSGEGSSIDYNITSYIPFLKNFILENKIKTIVDLGCGDFRCGPSIYNNLDIKYYGYDAYKKVIDNHNRKYDNNKYQFFHTEINSDRHSIVDADLCIIKDVLQHWNNKDITELLDYLVDNKKFKYILICNCCNQNSDNADTNPGGFRGLTCSFLPLNKYNIKKLYNYNTKEISVISIDK